MIKFLHLLSVTVFCTINLIECSIHDELRNYYDSSVQQQFKEEWKKYRRAFENEIASGLRENFGTSAMNIYEADKHASHLIARGFQLTDGVVMVYFNEMILRELPTLLRPQLSMELPNNFVNFESKLGRMFIDSTYYVARNSSSTIYARPEDQKALSPFSLQQVDTIGKVVIIVEDCGLSGISVSTLSGDSVTQGHSPFLLSDCKLTVEISTPNSGAAPVIAPYFSHGPKETLEMVLARPIREELLTKLQGAMYSYINTSVLFGDQAVAFRNNQQKLFKSYAEFMTDYVADLNRKTIQLNKGHAKLPDYEADMNTETDQKRLQCHVALTEIILYGLDTAYVTRAGGPFNDGSSLTAADAIIFSSMQIRGKISHDDEKGLSTKEFAAELTDVTVIVVIVIEEEKTKLQQIHFTGWRSLEFSIVPRETPNYRHVHQSLVYGHILNELPVLVLNHVSTILGHGPIDENKLVGGDGNGGNGGGSDNGGGDDNGGGSSDGGANENRSAENDAKKTDHKTKGGFFSDDILDDNFFSDDNMFSDDVLDKQFLNDSKEILDKNFLNDSKENLDTNFLNDNKENTPNEGKDNSDYEQGKQDVYDDVNETTTGAVTESDDKEEDNINGGDEGGVSNDMINEGGDHGNNAGGDDVDTANAPDETNRNVDDEAKFSIDEKETEPSFDNTAVDKNAESDDEEQVKANMESDFLSDGFLKSDFFSDDDFGGKEKGDATNKVKENDKDQIDSTDDGNDIPDVNDGNGEQVDEDERDIDGDKKEVVEGNNEKDKDYIEADSDANSGGQADVDNEPFFSDNKEPFFSDDFIENDFIDNDLIETDFFSDDFGGKEQGDATGKAKENNENDKDQRSDSADDGNDVPDVNVSNGEQVDEDERNIDGDKEEVMEGNNDDSAGHVGMHEENIDSSEKKTADDDKPFFSDDILDKDFLSDEKTHMKAKLNGSQQLPDENKDFFSDGNKPFFSDDNKPFMSDNNKPFMSDDNKPFMSDDNKAFMSDDNKPFMPDNNKPFMSDERSKLKDKVGGSNTAAGIFDDNKPFFSDDDKPFFSDDNKPLFSDENIQGEKTKLKSKVGGNKQNKGNYGEIGNGDANVDIGKKKLFVMASREEGFLDEKIFSDMEIERRDASRRHVTQVNDTANARDQLNRDGDSIKSIPIEKQNSIKSTSKENVTESVKDSRADKNVLPSNVHNSRRHQNVRTSENEIR